MATSIDVDDVSYTGVTNLVQFFKFLFENNLEDGAVKYLADQGIIDIKISQQVVYAVKDYIRNLNLADKLGTDDAAKQKLDEVVMCGCCSNTCRN